MAPIEACPICPSDLLCITNPVTKEESCALSTVIEANQCVEVFVRHIGGDTEQSACVIGKALGGYVIDGGVHHRLVPGQELAIRGVTYTGTGLRNR